jgi:very-short-patch-repair endonuclease
MSLRGSEEDTGLRISLEYHSRFNHAMQANGVPLVRRLRIENRGGEPLSGVELKITSEPQFSSAWEGRIESIPPFSTHNLVEVGLEFTPGKLLDLLEREPASILVTAAAAGGVSGRETFPVELLALNEWAGSESLPEILAAFVLPHDPAVARLLRRAAGGLEQMTGDPALSGYREKDPARVRAAAAAIYQALQELRISLESLPASSLTAAQRVRTPSEVLEQRLGSGLELSLLYAACLERAGLHPLLCEAEGHTLAAVWLQDSAFPEPVITEPLRLRKRADLDLLLLVETAAIARAGEPPFEAAAEDGRRRLDEPERFEQAIDVESARSRGIQPLPLDRSKAGEPVEAAGPGLATSGNRQPDVLADRAPSAAGPPAPSLAEHPHQVAQPPEGRLERWRRKLLDLSLRNRLLNFRETRKTIPVLSHDIAGFEDGLAEGREFLVQPMPAPKETAGSPAGRTALQRGRDQPLLEYLRSELASRRLRSPLPEEELERRLMEVHRAARLSLEESGANTLYLALGYLVWYETPASQEPLKAPILLLPLTIERRSAREGFRLSLAEDEPRINVTLLEKLEKEFEIRVEGLKVLPQDGSGFDVAGILRAFREAVLEVDRWEVIEEAWIGLFSFNKFLLWRDLDERAPLLLENRVVKHLVESPNQPFEPEGKFPDPARLDEERRAGQTFCLRDADSSQLAAVFAAADGRSFVLEGPPGTGKSQTITNLISHCLAEGKRVLFVAEKQAALNVVHRRLVEGGLAPFCLELHSNKANKLQVIRQVGEPLVAAARRSPEEWEARAQKLEELRRELNEYVEALHRPREIGESVFQATSLLTGLAGEPRFPLALEAAALDRARLAALREAVARLQATGVALGAVAGHAFSGSRREGWSSEVGSKVKPLAASLGAQTLEIEEAVAGAAAALGLPERPWSLPALNALTSLVESLLESPAPPPELLSTASWEETGSRIRGWIEKGRERDRLRDELRPRYDPRLLKADLEGLWARLESGLAGIPPLSWLRRWSARRALRPFVLQGRLPRSREICADLGRAIRLRGLEEELAASSHEARRLLGRFFRDGQPDWDEIERLQAWTGRFKSALSALEAHLPAAQRGSERWIRLACLERDSLAPGTPAGRELRDFRKEWNRFLPLRDEAVSFLELDSEVSFGKGEEEGYLRRVGERAAAWKAEPHSLRDWCAWRRARRPVVEMGLEPLARACEEGRLEAAGLSRSFERSFHEWWLEEKVRSERLLKDFFSPDHEERIEQFRRLDRELLGLTREVVAARLSARVPVVTGEASGSSEVGILQRELKKQRRHIPVRQLLEKIPNLLPRLKPCLLMSPLSVAQYLDPAFHPADLVVFDEASQIPVWDAVGPISRGRQVIVVGDSRQLPPTMFFEKLEDEEDGPAETETVELESILDECVAAGLPQLYLEWHYRSRHESLIAFSNYQYYQNRLLTFPSAVNRSPGLGVSLARVEGVYDRARSCTNLIEARTLSQEVVRRLRDPVERRRSLGIVTFSLAQQIVVENLLELERRRDPEIDLHFTPAVPEPVFVKNLENVQGDERDVILLSVAYGPDARGRVAMNFGPLNRDGGQRRLNVAITRAREEVVVFSSLTADQIDLKRTSALGVQHLKGFLDYAQRGPSALAEIVERKNGGGFESPFEKEVCAGLRSRGWKVDLQVGCSGYRIDVGVKDPRRDGAYLMGIECDGASYRSGRTARDRDRLRAEVLAQLGWNLRRVWSSDWWYHPEKTLDDLDRRLKQALEERAPAAAGLPPGGLPPAPPVPVAPPPAARSEPAARSPAGPPGLEGREVYQPYRPAGASPPPQDLFDDRSTVTLRDLLLEIVARESPVSAERAARIAGRSLGLERLTHRAKSRILEVAGKECAGVRLIDGFLWAPDQSPECYRRFRVPTEDPQSSREAEEIPLEEISSAARAVLKGQVSMPLGELARETARLFGFDRIGHKLELRMEEGIRRLARLGGCALSGTVVSLVDP